MNCHVPLLISVLFSRIDITEVSVLHGLNTLDVEAVVEIFMSTAGEGAADLLDKVKETALEWEPKEP